MAKVRARQLFSGLAAGALVALAAGTVPGSAQAQPSGAGYSIDFPDLTVAADTTPRRAVDVVAAAESAPLAAGTVKFDFAQLTELATIAPYSAGCTIAGTVITCPFENENDLTDQSYLLDLAVKASAADDQTGTIKTKIVSGTTVVAERTTTVTIGEGVDLVAGPKLERTAQRGDRVDIPVTVRNAGSTAVRKPVLSMDWHYALKPVTTYENCFYTEFEAYCEFDTDLAPGATYGLSDPLRYDVRQDIVVPSGARVEYRWHTTADATERLRDLRASNPRPGSAGKLGLAAAPPAAQALAARQADTRPADNWSYVSFTLTGTNSTDLAAVGVEAHGAVGSTVKAKFGVKNLGAAVVDFPATTALGQWSVFTVPVGATAVSVPKRCSSYENDQTGPAQPGKRKYLCATADLLKVGDVGYSEFGLRIDVAGQLKGELTINRARDGQSRPDLNAANDKAEIVISQAANPGGGVPGTGGSGGGVLPVTGANVAIMTGTGVALVLLGGFGYWLARRRRATRFVA